MLFVIIIIILLSSRPVRLRRDDKKLKPKRKRSKIRDDCTTAQRTADPRRVD